MEQTQSPRSGPVCRRSRRWRYFTQMLGALVVFTALIPGVASAASGCASGGFLEKYCQVDADDETGVTIALHPGVWYTLQVYMGSWQAQSWGGPLYYNGWVTNNSGTSWYRMATAIDSNDVDRHWAGADVEDLGGGYYQMTWRATTSSIRFRVADAPGKFYDNSGALYLWLAPLP